MLAPNMFKNTTMIITKARVASLLTSIIFTLGMMLPAGLMAQVPSAQPQQQQEAPDYSDEELEAFVATTEDIMKIQQKYQEKMVSAIEEEGLTAQEFQSFSQSQQSGQETEMSEEKKESYANAMNSVVGIQQEMQQEMQTVVQEGEMEVQEYQQMSMHIQQSPELSQKVEGMMQEKAAESE